MKRNDINIDELIADAKAIKDTAMANAKKTLEEAFAPRLQNMISAKLQTEEEEMDNEPEDTNVEVDNAPETDEPAEVEPTSDPVLEPSATDIPSTNEPATVAPVSSTTPVAPIAPEVPVTPVVSDEPTTVQAPVKTTVQEPVQTATNEPIAPVSNPAPDETVVSDDTEDEDNLELESIIKELEDSDESDDTLSNSVSDEEIDLDESDFKFDDELEESDFKFDDELDESDFKFDDESDDSDESDEINLDEINLDEILREVYEDGFDETSKEAKKDEKTKDIYTENKKLKSALAETRRKNQELATLLNEINLLNAKLLYVNKIFKNFNLDSKQKLNVIDNFDRTNSLRESKLIYVTICESLKTTNLLKSKSVNKITEGLASRSVKSDVSVKKIITESAVSKHDDTLVDSDGMVRMMKLAGIKTKK